jgi:hypothetical protein
VVGGSFMKKIILERFDCLGVRKSLEKMRNKNWNIKMMKK